MRERGEHCRRLQALVGANVPDLAAAGVEIVRYHPVVAAPEGHTAVEAIDIAQVVGFADQVNRLVRAAAVDDERLERIGPLHQIGPGAAYRPDRATGAADEKRLEAR